MLLRLGPFSQQSHIQSIKNRSTGTNGASFRLNEFLLYDANSSRFMHHNYLARITDIHNMESAQVFGIYCQNKIHHLQYCGVHCYTCTSYHRLRLIIVSSIHLQ